MTAQIYGAIKSIITEMGGRFEKGLVCVLAILFASLPIASFSQTATPGLGSVQGVVLDQERKPVSGASVYGYPAQDFKKQISTISDAQGYFNLDGFPPGDVYLHAYKESDGYPNDFFAFYDTPGRSQNRVTVDAGKAVTGLVIQLGSRSAYLKIDITEASGAPVSAQLVFARDDGKEGPRPYERSAPPQTEGMLVPPVPFRLTVEAEGYEPWHYGGQNWQSREGLISLKSGETLNVTVRLKRP